MLQDRQFDEPSEPRTESRTITMTAAARTSYGPPNVVRIAEVHVPDDDDADADRAVRCLADHRVLHFRHYGQDS